VRVFWPGVRAWVICATRGGGGLEEDEDVAVLEIVGDFGAEAEELGVLGSDGEVEMVPDADGDEARAPIPAVVVAGLEVFGEHGEPGLALFLGRGVEDDTEAVLLAVAEGGGEIEAMAEERAFEGGDDAVIDEDPAAVIEAVGVEEDGVAGRGGDLHVGEEFPVAVLDPFALEGAEAVVPIGEDARGAEGGLGGAGNGGGDGGGIGVEVAAEGLVELPGEGAPALDLPGLGGEIDFH
jgi:hypothetical protein